MKSKIKKVAVLGSGVMGAQIAGHLANAGISSFLFDLKKSDVENSKESLKKLKPAPLYIPKNINLIHPCTYDEDIKKIKEVDWVIEVVTEDLNIKNKIYNKVLPHLSKTAILSSNTSGIPLVQLTGSLPANVKERFLITHFFNPPRYMHLLELIKGEFTSNETYQLMVDFCNSVLGKGIVHAKDTPNFIGNRIGVFGLMVSIDLAVKHGLTVEEVDKLTGPISGRPKSATFRTADIVGLDTLEKVSLTTFDKAPNDEERLIFKIPDILEALIKTNRLGQKTGTGFYRKNEDRTIESIDLNTAEYKPIKKVLFDCFRVAKDQQSLTRKLNALCYGDDKGSKYFWEIMSKTLIYSANRIPEISNDIINIDNAMKWGFGWEMGPFESWDAIGLKKSVEKMHLDGKVVPKWVNKMLKNGRNNFYEIENGIKSYWCPKEKKALTIPNDKKSLSLILLKSKNRVLKKDLSASIIDLGDGILNVEFHSILQPTLNPIDGSYVEIINKALDLVESNEFKGLVIGNEGPNFSAGANLNLLLELSQNEEWNSLEYAVKKFQDLSQRIRFSPKPVVAAPFQLTLGGGVEIVQPAAHRVAAAETYMGLVEVGVGLIPGGGGNLRMILNALDSNTGRMGAFQKIKNTFEIVGFAKIAKSAEEAKELGYLNINDTIVLNRSHLLKVAKDKALELSEDYNIPTYRKDLKLPGAGGRTAMSMALKSFKIQGKISDHDLKIGEKLAYVLTGGNKAGLTKSVDEQYILDIEREAFLSLASEKLTQDRIRYMLKRGKPLRN